MQFAQPYVLAHEYGHHLQNLLGTSDQVRRQQERDPDNANELSVRLELQADCLAGVWAKHADRNHRRQGQPIFKSLTQQDIDQALEAAAAIGDDAIQKKSGRPVDECLVHPRHLRATAAVVQQRLLRAATGSVATPSAGRSDASYQAGCGWHCGHQ